MPLRWEILHDQRLVHVVAEGPVTLKEMEAHFDALVVAEALPYSKLFDATAVLPVYDDNNVMAMGAGSGIYRHDEKRPARRRRGGRGHPRGLQALRQRLALQAPIPVVRHRGRGARLAGDGGRPGRRPAPRQAVRVEGSVRSTLSRFCATESLRPRQLCVSPQEGRPFWLMSGSLRRPGSATMPNAKFFIDQTLTSRPAPTTPCFRSSPRRRPRARTGSSPTASWRPKVAEPRRMAYRDCRRGVGRRQRRAGEPRQQVRAEALYRRARGRRPSGARGRRRHPPQPVGNETDDNTAQILKMKPDAWAKLKALIVKVQALGLNRVDARACNIGQEPIR